MANSGFHGIFNALQREGMDKRKPDELEEELEPVRGVKQKGVGQVAVDIYEHENYYIIKAPIAGVKLSDLDIEVNENVLTIRGHRRQADQIPDSQYYLQECYWGPFSRSVTLPFQIDPKKVKATFNKDSVLKILVPKEEKIKIVRIQEG